MARGGRSWPISGKPFFVQPSEAKRLARGEGGAKARTPDEARWWPAANMLANALEAGLTPESLREVSWRTVLRLDRVSSAWSRSATTKDDDAPRKATQADIRAMLQ